MLSQMKYNTMLCRLTKAVLHAVEWTPGKKYFKSMFNEREMFTERSSEEGLIDHSTRQGQWKKILFRWKSVVGPLTVIAFIILALTLFLTYRGGSDSVETKNSPAIILGAPTGENFTLQDGQLSFNGDPSRFTYRHFDSLPQFPSTLDPSIVTAIDFRYVRINGPNFTNHLSAFPNLERLHLQNVTVFGFFKPVKLAKLNYFFISQGIDRSQDEKELFSFYDKTKYPSPYLRSTLFFLGEIPSVQEFEHALASQPLDYLSIWMKGSIVYVLDKSGQEVRLNLPYCSEIMQSITFPYKSLTLSSCHDTVAEDVSPDITFLNLYLILNSTDELLSNILQRAQGLTDLYIELPERRLNLDDLPPNLRLLSISSMLLDATNETRAYALKEFYFGGENQYGWVENRTTPLNENILNAFPNLERLAMFEVMGPERYHFVKGAFTRPHMTWALCVGFPRRSGDFIGLPQKYEKFILERKNGTIMGRPITNDDELAYRYELLGWSPIDSFPKFYYVQKIIKNGGILGNSTANPNEL